MIKYYYYLHRLIELNIEINLCLFNRKQIVFVYYWHLKWLIYIDCSDRHEYFNRQFNLFNIYIYIINADLQLNHSFKKWFLI